MRRARKIDIQTISAKAIIALADFQTSHGSFPSTSSLDIKAFSKLDSKETVFPSCLITYCLYEAKAILPALATEQIIKGVKSYLLTEKSKEWSWNYASRDKAMSLSMSYPDDLDDTSCALVALLRTGLALDGSILAHYVQHLLTCETAEGGPYRTWIVPRNQKGWNDVDPGVNANIAYLLALQDVNLDNLTTYIDSRVESLEFGSLYYHDDLAIIYFISRFYSVRPDRKSAKVVRLSQRLIEYMEARARKDGSYGTPLETALALCSLSRLGYSKQRLSRGIAYLAASQDRDGFWAAFPFYIEEVKAKKPSYAGSKALTTAFALEAIALSSATKIPKAPQSDAWKESERKKIRRLFKAFFSATRASFYTDAKALYEKFRSKGLEDFIILLPHSFDRAIKADTRAGKEMLADLGLANMLGWIGYTIQDDIADEGKNSHLMPLSNICIREAESILESLSTDDGAYVRKTFDQIDSANAFESRSLILYPRENGSEIPLSLHCNERALCDKSFGHVLGPLVILMHRGWSPETKEFRAVESFFRHYIIARQLCDDAHDWEKDLRGGRANSTSVGLLKQYRKKSKRLAISEISIKALKEKFWKKHIESICADIDSHIRSAREALTQFPQADQTYFEGLLAPLAASAEKALSQRNMARDFLKKFG